MLQIFQLCQNQSFPQEKTDFWGFVFYWNCQMKQHFFALVEQITALRFDVDHEF